MPEVIYDKVMQPEIEDAYVPIDLTDKTKQEHFNKVLRGMKREGLQLLLVYADREHGANFAYLTGFEPRFEEAVCVLHEDGRAYLLLGNENLKMCKYSSLKAAPIHVPYFSLPNQPMENEKNLEGLLKEAGISDNRSIGIAGWKLFTSKWEDNEQIFDVPYFIVDAVKRLNPKGRTVSAGALFLHPENGVRVTVNANEAAHYEFGAGLASSRLLKALNSVEPGRTEMEIAGLLSAGGQPVSVTTICATGERFAGGVVFPRNKKICLGDRFSVTLGLRGGLSSRAAYVVEREEELEPQVRDYMEAVAKPYYRAAAAWYEAVGIGITGGKIYEMIEKILPKDKYRWSLNPGHYTSDEEWLSSPLYPESQIKIRSGMLLQMDIIPGIAGYGGAGAEDGIAVADEILREELREEYPEVWNRMCRRRAYMLRELGIRLKPEILPLSDIAGYMRPYLLNREKAFRVNNKNR